MRRERKEMADYLKLKTSNCKNCYKCIRNCPVKSIAFSQDQANILGDECILCGQCFVACPQNAKEIRKDIGKAKELIESGAPIYVSLAPSFVANYHKVTLASMRRALTSLGFSEVEETAIGATIVKKEYERMLEQDIDKVMISSCCHTVNLLIQKYYPLAIPYLAPVITPMEAHCRDIKRRHPESKTIFIGPCISKKEEGERYKGYVDCVLTFEELTLWLNEEDIHLEYIEEEQDEGRARFFPVAGGILKTMDQREEYAYLAVDGIKNCTRAIEDIIDGKITKCFVEMSACNGSCIGGPGMDREDSLPIRDYIAIKSYAKKKDFNIEVQDTNRLRRSFASCSRQRVAISNLAIEEVLNKIGKTRPEHELNCGSCGYNTCRDKARAVLEGKANLAMCLPYLKEKAESFSDIIIKNTPNAIIVLNESFEVQQINGAALELLKLKNEQDILGDQVVRILDPTPFFEAYQKGQNTFEKLAYLADYGRYVEQTVIYDKSNRVLISLMKDVTEEVRQRENKEALSRRTIEITDKVIEKQMRAVQEIASLLGETTAETKIALVNLKELLNNE
ncbi:[Fe-Fe] hydrogenase large subunit C-terminal domain-containing protein [Alloiococcus sp. CFN-8]|uniref:[Fe-Fe] hydrogenase large subunit C-terminal domain-containing protein n=1 Tax=Alloiococcus sp. CFN-8 TaxID=3416081 RepID=UPI003CF7000E